MSKLLDKRGRVATDDPWRAAGAEQSDAHTEEYIFLPAACWREHGGVLNTDVHGLLLTGEDEPMALATLLSRIKHAAIQFPVFSDGRGFSLACILRGQLEYSGTLRAVGHIIPDQIFSLIRCGFDTFEISCDTEEQALMTFIKPFNVTYQACLEYPEPLFRRRI